MWGRLSIVAGLVVGVAVAGLLLGGIFALTPDRPAPAAPASTAPAASIATPSVAPSASASPSASPSVAPSASAAGAPFHVGQVAPRLVVPKVGGGTIDIAGLKTILPGVDVTPVSLGDGP